jgi:hypothetical protein
MRATRLASLPDRHLNRPPRPCWLLPPARDEARGAEEGEGQSGGLSIAHRGRNLGEGKGERTK